MFVNKKHKGGWDWYFHGLNLLIIKGFDTKLEKILIKNNKCEIMSQIAITKNGVSVAPGRIPTEVQKKFIFPTKIILWQA